MIERQQASQGKARDVRKQQPARRAHTLAAAPRRTMTTSAATLPSANSGEPISTNA